MTRAVPPQSTSSLRHFLANAVLSDPERAVAKYGLSVDEQLRYFNVSDFYGSFDYIHGQKMRRSFDKLQSKVLTPLLEFNDAENKLLLATSEIVKSMVLIQIAAKERSRTLRTLRSSELAEQAGYQSVKTTSTGRVGS